MRQASASAKASLFRDAARLFGPCDATGILRWFVPGRIEVLGKHTDYAGGRSLLCAAERGFCVVARPRSDTTVRLTDIVRGLRAEFQLSADLRIPDYGWKVYPMTVARRLARNFPGSVSGADIVVASDLPSAAGMSSSSAFVVATFAVLSAVNDLANRPEYQANIRTPEGLAGYLGCIENGQSFGSLTGDSGVGTFGGSEDHTAILCSRPGRFVQYSFCPVRFERAVPVPAGCTFVIGVSGVAASKTGAAKLRYNRASLSAAAILSAWRDASDQPAVTLADAVTASPDNADRIRSVLRQVSYGGFDSSDLLRRFDQFCLESENLIPAAAEALDSGDLAAFGSFVDQSQSATEELLRNQVPETASLARAARSLGAYAASAFGAGFGGSVWALVDQSRAPAFLASWKSHYQADFPRVAPRSQFFVTAPGPALIQV